jgi:dTDP-4-dehydrorhamnose 3,5-epimerase
MKIRQLGIEGAFEITPVQHGDPRGQFLEWYRFDHLAAELGHPLRLAQANLSTSAAGVVRGVHFASVPPGQAKYVTVTAGAGIDYVIDIRVGSPTFGTWEAIRLDDVDRRAVYIGEGLGHAFCALTDGAALTYLCSETYNPRNEHAVHPLDPDLAIEWAVQSPLLSAKDEAAPTLAEARERGLLPDYERCREYVAGLRARENS